MSAKVFVEGKVKPAANKRAIARRKAEYILEQERLSEQQHHQQHHHRQLEDETSLGRCRRPLLRSRFRRPISEAEMVALVGHLDKRQSSHFGIVKLAKLDLDQPFVADDPLPRYLKGLWPHRTATLAEIAASRRRDASRGTTPPARPPRHLTRLRLRRFTEKT